MSSELLTSLLKEVSRSFYLTMRVLPTAIRAQISLAYLLARTSDTIADTEILSVERRLKTLNLFRIRILGRSDTRLDFGELAGNHGLPAEQILLERSEEAIALLSHFSLEDQQKISAVLEIIVGGQELDLKRFRQANEKQIVALQTMADLDDYTYRVAGCVGEFWTKMCRAHLFPKAELDDARLLADGVRFGKGLQLVNILRDLPRDLRMGRCYIPQEELNGGGLMPDDLLTISNEEKFRPIYEKFLGLAEQHLAAGWEYTKYLPRNQFRVRLACAWPILIGARTIQKLRSEKILDATRRVKVSRTEVRDLIVKSVLLYPFPSRWDSQFSQTCALRKCC